MTDTCNNTTKHHELTPGAVKQQHEAVSKIKAALLMHGNPFAVEGNQLYNLITHACPRQVCASDPEHG